MSGCACKCHESHPSLHCLRCAPSSDPVGEAFRAPVADALRTEQREWLEKAVDVRRDTQPTCTLPLPDMTELWARVFEEGDKHG